MPYRNVNVFSSDSKFNLLKWDWLVAEASQSTSTRDSTRAVEQLSKWTSIQKRFYCNSSVNPSANWAPELEGDCTHTNTGASTKTTWICLTVWSLDCYWLVMCSLLQWIKLSCTGRMDIGFSSEKHWRTLCNNCWTNTRWRGQHYGLGNALTDNVHPYIMIVFPWEDGILQLDNASCHMASSLCM